MKFLSVSAAAGVSEGLFPRAEITSGSTPAPDTGCRIGAKGGASCHANETYSKSDTQKQTFAPAITMSVIDPKRTFVISNDLKRVHI